VPASYTLARLSNTTLFSYICARDAARYGAAAHIDPHNPPATFRFSKPHMTNSNGNPAKRFIWVSFEHDGSAPTDEPTEVVRVMGLNHFPTGDFVYLLPDGGSGSVVSRSTTERGAESWTFPA
jgi:hypothetical protein